MLKIGAFSSLSQISIHMLRHYDEIGLLIPVVDPSTGYRYYHEKQLPVANRIQALKSMGFGLAQIKEILKNYEDDDRLCMYLNDQANTQRDEIARLDKRLLLLESTVLELETYNSAFRESISTKLIPTRKVVSYRGIIPSRQHEGLLWKQLAVECARAKVEMATPSYNIALFHDDEYRDSDVDVEVQRTVLGSYKTTNGMQFQTVAEVQVAAMVYQGRYDLLAIAHEQLIRWIMENHRQVAGKAFNIYHISPETEPHPDNLVTEVCIPIQ
jgi:DNA-binding transcriptional MerR regulator/effector-binding domain-containing protein